MNASIRPSMLKNGGKMAAGGLGGGGLLALVIYFLFQSINASDDFQAKQGTIDAKQDMRIEQAQKDIAEGKEDRKRILKGMGRMERKLERIGAKIDPRWVRENGDDE